MVEQVQEFDLIQNSVLTPEQKSIYERWVRSTDGLPVWGGETDNYVILTHYTGEHVLPPLLLGSWSPEVSEDPEHLEQVFKIGVRHACPYRYIMRANPALWGAVSTSFPEDPRPGFERWGEIMVVQNHGHYEVTFSGDISAEYLRRQRSPWL